MTKKNARISCIMSLYGVKKRGTDKMPNTGFTIHWKLVEKMNNYRECDQSTLS